jgi:hypothetical protein
VDNSRNLKTDIGLRMLLKRKVNSRAAIAGRSLSGAPKKHLRWSKSGSNIAFRFSVRLTAGDSATKKICG